MIDQTVTRALKVALRRHEIGNASPYRLFFAGKGKSGASFGFMQGDLAAGQPEVQRTFRAVLVRAGIAPEGISSFVRRLSVHLIKNPLDTGETQLVNSALKSASDLIDAMDDTIFAGVARSLETCIARAAGADLTIMPQALIYMALWINMSGPPTKLLSWLSGQSTNLGRHVQPATAPVTAADMEAYLQATNYYLENPQNFAHMRECAAAGAAELVSPPKAESFSPTEARSSWNETAAALPEHFAYEQASGRMFLVTAAGPEIVGSGYSGSSREGGRNDPAKQCVEDVGPLPRGLYAIGRPRLGPSPFSLPLVPSPTNLMCGRGGFYVHGDSLAAPGGASHGCIILDLPVRRRIAAAPTHILRVVDLLAARAPGALGAIEHAP